MSSEWTNWSGSLRFRPARVERPADEGELVALVRRAAAVGRVVRPVGAGHSSSRLVETDDVLVSLEHFRGVEAHGGLEATVGAGTTIEDMSKALLAAGLAMHNLGDVDMQHAAGATATGTHGTGKDQPILAAAVVGVRMVTAAGEVATFSQDQHPEVLRAARVSLGALGVFTALRLRLLPAFDLRHREWCAHVDDCLAHLDELVARHRNFDFYWYPRRDEVRMRTWDPPGEGPDDLPYARCIEDQTGPSGELLPGHSGITRKFEETEYSVPAEAGPACFREVCNRVRERHRKWVCWRTLYRTVAADDAYLSHAHGRATVTISLHQNASLPYREYFADLEPILRAHGGRPHWGKKFNLTGDELRPLYPMWDRFREVRRRLDPDGRFLSPYLRSLFEPEGGS
ncbi:MAG TPA: D-arabinono-1,4-lactone oxidase [Gemmataceae bacterium]|nr:D-arabinono-1,4-lactone oxidase [Gemmataceae bacterium]